MNAPTQIKIHRLKEEGACWSGGALTVSSEELKFLHTQLGIENEKTRIQIDTYLLACYLNFSLPNMNYVLNINDTYHYYNLPNLIPLFIKNLSKNSWNQNLISCYLSMFCLQLKKIKNMQSQHCTQYSAAMINLLHGTLLGLYPYNIKHHAFATRCKIAGFLRNVLTSDGHTEFLSENDILVQFCTIEYLSNVILDFCPVEESLLLKNYQLRFSLNQLFESFRKSIDDIVDDNFFFKRLNILAGSILPTIFRQLKLYSYRLPKKVINFKTQAKLHVLLDSNGCFESILNSKRVYANVDNLVAQAKIIFPDFSFEELRAVEFLWKTVNINALPQLMLDKQEQKLNKCGACQYVQNSLTTMPVCIPCALKTKNCVFTQKFAYNCVSQTLHCANCSKEVINVNLLGRIFTIRDFTYYLCPTCLHVKIWDGQSIWSCSMCTLDNASNVMQSCCVACPHRKVFENLHNIVDMDNIKLCSVPLCFHHAKQLPICPSSAYDLKMIYNELKPFVSEK